MATLTQLIAGFGITTGTILIAIWAGAKIFGEKWLDSHFATKIESLKHEGQAQLEGIKLTGQTQLERIKHENAGALDRVVKLNQREFEVVPDIWIKTTDAHYAILRLISVFQESPDLSRMPPSQFEAFLDKTQLEEWQKEEIRNKSGYDRTSYYSDISGLQRLKDANEALVKFNIALLGGSIFLHPETFSKFEDFAKPMRTAFNHFRIDVQMGIEYQISKSKDPNEPINLYRKEGDERYNALGKYLRERYWINAQGEAV